MLIKLFKVLLGSVEPTHLNKRNCIFALGSKRWECQKMRFVWYPDLPSTTLISFKEKVSLGNFPYFSRSLES